MILVVGCPREGVGDDATQVARVSSEAANGGVDAATTVPEGPTAIAEHVHLDKVVDASRPQVRVSGIRFQEVREENDRGRELNVAILRHAILVARGPAV